MTFDIEEIGEPEPVAEAPAGPALRPYQTRLREDVAAAIEHGHKRILVVLPTGGGKTVVIADAVSEAVARGGEGVLFIAHRRELIKQASGKLFAVGVDHGIIQAGFPSRPQERVQVASIQTFGARALRSRSIELPKAGLVVIDEAHHARAATYQEVVAAYPDAVILGFTATPSRGDGRGLGNIFQHMVLGPNVAELIRLGYLVPPVAYAPSRPDLKGVKVTAGDYNEKQLAERMDVPKLVGDVVSHWLRLAKGRKTVIFATSVAHSAHLRNGFRDVGVMAEHIDGTTPAEERDAILARLAAGTVDIVVNCAVLTEGFDCPDISCVVLARPTKSLVLYLQMVGRGMRPAPGKTDVLVIDHAGACIEHGLPDEEIEWTLREDQRAESRAQKARKAGRAPKLTECPECKSIRMQGKPCSCGWRPQPKPAAVDFEEGELGRVGRDRKAARVDPSDAQRRAFYQQLLGMSAAAGWAKGAAAHRYKEKFGAFPPWSWNSLPPMPADDAVRAWVRSRNIAYAKAKARYGQAGAG